MSRNNETGAGAKAERARVRRQWALSALLVIAFALVEVWLRPYLHHAPGERPHLPALVAVITAAVLGLTLSGGIWRAARLSDELEHRQMLIAGFAGFMFNCSAVAIWECLSAGNLVPSPDASILFFATAAVFVGTIVWLKVRERISH